ncbi:MAG TPA: hypothetical protein PK336_00260 [Methanoculleus sp.]|nr:hypothetical protein [Methanoculleus sp.]
MKKYRGRTEAERIECALKTRDIEQAIEFLANARLLTQSILDTLQECRTLYCEEIPDVEPVEDAVAEVPAGEPEPIPAAVKPAATRKMRPV